MPAKRKLRQDSALEGNDFSQVLSHKKSIGTGKTEASKNFKDLIDRRAQDEDQEHDVAEPVNDGQVQGREGEGDEDDFDNDERGTDVLEESAEIDEAGYSDSEQDAIASGSDSDMDSVEDEQAGKAAGGISAAYSRAFSKIMKKSVPDSSLADSLGPVLAENKKLVAKKLQEASEETKNPQASKEKREQRELGHVVPLTYTNAHEKTLIKVATRGVVLLFNAINKAQVIQAGVTPDTSKAVKAIAKKSKSAFLAELKGLAHSRDPQKSEATEDDEADEGAPSWSVLQDNFLLNKSKLKDWDKRVDAAPADDLSTFDDQSDGGSD